MTTASQYASVCPCIATVSLRATGLLAKVVQHPGTQHGYAVRAPKNDAVAQEARKDALKQALEFFEQVLSGSGGVASAGSAQYGV